MNSDYIWAGFWLSCVGVVSVAAVVVNASNNTWNANNAKTIAEMVRAGTDPLKAFCAVYDEKNAPLCMAAMIKP